MADPFRIKANDRKPSLQATLGFVGSAAVPALAGATVSFIMKEKNGAAADSPKVNAAAVVVDVDTAVVRYDWAVGDTDTPGEFYAEFEVMGADGKTQTFPTDAYLDVVIYADLDGAS